MAEWFASLGGGSGMQGCGECRAPEGRLCIGRLASSRVLRKDQACSRRLCERLARVSALFGRELGRVSPVTPISALSQRVSRVLLTRILCTPIAAVVHVVRRGALADGDDRGLEWRLGVHAAGCPANEQ